MNIVLLLALLIGGLRVFGVTHVAYQAAAHLFVGGLFGAWLMDKHRKWLLVLFVAMTVLETICFFAGTVKLGQ